MLSANVTFPITVIGDGSDESSSIQTQLNAVPDGTVNQPNIALFPATPFRAEATLSLTSRNNFEVRDAVLYSDVFAPFGNSNDRTRCHWKVRTSTNVTFRECDVRGAHPAGGTGDAAYNALYEAQHGFDIGGTDIELDRCNVTDVYGDFFYVGNGASSIWIHGSASDRIVCTRNGRQGLSVTDAADVLFEWFNIGEIRRSTFDLEANTAADAIQRITIQDGLIGNGRLNLLACAGPAALVEDVIIRRLTCTGTPPDGRGLNSQISGWTTARRARFSFIDCVSSIRYGAASDSTIDFTNVDGVTVTGCVQPMGIGLGMYLVNATNCTAVDVHGNTVLDGAGELEP